MKLHLALLIASILASPALADVRVVSSSGPFTTIQAALDASTDGDIVLVRPGTYGGFSVPDRSLTVVADSGGAVNVNGSIAVPVLGVTHDVVLSGLRVTSVETADPYSSYPLRASNCSGSLRVQRCEFVATQPTSHCHPHADGALLQSCQDVVFVDTRLHGASNTFNVLPGSGDSQRAGSGLMALSSRLALYECELTGGPAGLVWENCDPSYGYGSSADNGAPGGHALYAVASFVHVAHSILTGGRGGDADTAGCGHGGNGGAGALVSAPLGLWALDVVAQGGAGGFGFAGPGFPCAHHDGTPGVNWAPGPSTFAAPARRLDLPPLAREGDVVALALHGEPGDLVELFVAPATGFRFSTSWRGVNVLARQVASGAIPAAVLGVVPASGVLHVSWTIGELGTGVQGATLHVQPAFTSVTGRVTMGTPRALALVDGAF